MTPHGENVDKRFSLYYKKKPEMDNPLMMIGDEDEEADDNGNKKSS